MQQVYSWANQNEPPHTKEALYKHKKMPGRKVYRIIVTMMNRKETEPLRIWTIRTSIVSLCSHSSPSLGGEQNRDSQHSIYYCYPFLVKYEECMHMCSNLRLPWHAPIILAKYVFPLFNLVGRERPWVFVLMPNYRIFSSIRCT